MKLVINILLALIARISLYVLSAPLFITSLVLCIIKWVKYRIKQIRPDEPVAKFFLRLAEVMDIMACVLGGPVWNLILFKWNARPKIVFGHIRDTMSFVFGSNAEKYYCEKKFLKWKIRYFKIKTENLNGFGLFWCYVLEIADKDHLKQSVNPSKPKYEFLYFRSN